jgi:hypothetical protein
MILNVDKAPPKRPQSAPEISPFSPPLAPLTVALKCHVPRGGSEDGCTDRHSIGSVEICNILYKVAREARFSMSRVHYSFGAARWVRWARSARGRNWGGEVGMRVLFLFSGLGALRECDRLAQREVYGVFMHNCLAKPQAAKAEMVIWVPPSRLHARNPPAS